MYISPETLVPCLSVSTRLETLEIGFEFPQSYPDQRSRPPLPPTRTLLPALTSLCFDGVADYLEDLVARIDAPLLKNLLIVLFHQIVFDTPQLTQFISRAPTFKIQDQARMVFSSDVSVTLPQTFDISALKLIVSRTGRKSDQQLSSLAQICSSSFPQTFISLVEHLYILEDIYQGLQWQDDIKSSQWLELLHPCTSVKNLYISKELVLRIAPALQDLVGERVTEVLPVLRALFLESLPPGPAEEPFRQFIAAR